MLRNATWLVDFAGMSLALWLATYLVSRGFRSAVTRWAGLTLLLVTGAFVVSLYGLEAPEADTEGWWAFLLTLALLAWYRLTYQFLTPAMRHRVRWMARVVYVIGAVKLVVLGVASLQARVVSGDNILINPYSPGLFGLADILFLLTAAAGTLTNFRWGSRTGYGPHFRALWVASIFAAVAMTYGAAAIVTGPALPHLIQDALLVAAIALCGYAVARYQAFIERRTTLRDMPVSGLVVFLLAGLYGWLGSREGIGAFQAAMVVALAIVSHAAYDVVRDFLESVLHREESSFRRRLRALARDTGTEADLSAHLTAAQETLVRLLGATGGFVAVRCEAGFAVMASIASVPVGTLIDGAEVSVHEVGPPGPALAERVTYLAPAFAGNEQVAVIAIARRFNRGPYSETDLDLLADMADWVARLVEGESRQQARRAELLNLANAVQSGEAEMQAQARYFATTFEAQPNRAFSRQVEQALKHLADFATLGQSALVDELKVPGTTHIERGKALRQRLLTAVDSLRPSGPRPHGVLPREWRAFAVLHDAYVEDVPNREIMARLYIGEGNFNRERRKALQAVARALYETIDTTASAEPAGAQATPG